jgi:hypothetical protein
MTIIDEEMAVENPPLWVWAVIVGAIIAGKFIYRWYTTKQLAKESQETKETQTQRKIKRI